MDRPHPLPTKSDHAVHLVQTLYRYATHNKLTNFSINAAEASVQCHSPVLCAQNSFIDGLCANGASEATIQFDQPTKHAQQALEQTRRYMYLGTLELNEDIVEPVILVAQTMNHHALRDECERYMISLLDISNCRKSIDWAKKFDLVHLKQACQELKKTKFSLLINEAWFLPTLKVEDMVRYLEDDQLGVSSEDEALDAVSKWLTQCAATERKREEYRDMLLKHVRLTLCDQGKLEAAVDPVNTSTPSALQVRLLQFMQKKIVRGPETPRGQMEVIVGGRQGANIEHREILFPDTNRNSVPFPDAFDCCVYSVCRKGSTLYLSGGYHVSQKKSITSVYQFCCDRGTMEMISTLPFARDRHGSVLVGNRLYIIGGCYEEKGNIKTWHRIVHVLDVESMTWGNAQELPYGVESPSVVVVDEALYQLGGWLPETGWLTNGEFSRKVLKYEPQSDKWTGCSAMPQVATFCINSTVAVGTEIYVLARDKFLCYKTEQNQWSSLDAPPMASIWSSMIHLNGRLVASGGYETSNQQPHNRRQCYDLVSREWSLLEKTLPHALYSHFSFVTCVHKF
jgi:hypothetical protein